MLAIPSLARAITAVRRPYQNGVVTLCLLDRMRRVILTLTIGPGQGNPLSAPAPLPADAHWYEVRGCDGASPVFEFSAERP